MTKHRFKTSPFWAIAVAAALGMGLSACGGGSSNDGLSAAEEDALRQQVADAEAAKDQAEADKNKAEADKKALEDANTTAMNAADRAAMVAKGKALYSKLMYDFMTDGNTADGASAAINAGKVEITGNAAYMVSGLAKTDATVATMGDWMGAHYMKSTGTGANKVTTEARVYSNPRTATSVSAHDAKGLGSDANGLDRAAGKNTYAPSGAWMASRVMLDGLASSGTTTYEDEDEVKGSYAGATGTYMCGAEECTAAPATGGGVTLGDGSDDGGWTFEPDAGAMVKVPDRTYLYFGWWVRQNNDGPTHASAFYSSMGDNQHGEGNEANGSALTGTAKYMGVAAGKFAINYGDTANGGHFTADAMLNAKFGETGADDPTTNGLTGTINNFRLNDGSDNPGWSVSLKRATWDTAGSKYMSNGATATQGTEWSISGNDPAPGQAGNWEAQLFDEDGKDDNNSPTTVVGKFEAGFGGTHKMVGAFGATQ